MKKLLAGLVLTVLTLVGVAGYYGLVPGVSDLFGTNKPKDLGVHPTNEDLTSAQKKSGVTFSQISSANSPKETLKFSGKIDVDNFFTDEEMTTMALDNPWRYNFLKGSQVRFNPDGTTEMAGIFYVDKLKGYAKAHGLAEADIKPALDAVGRLPFNPPYYLKMKVSIENGHMNMNITDLEVGGIDLSVLAKANSSAIGSVIQDKVVNPTPGVKVDLLSTGDGVLNYKGTFAETISVAH